MPPLDFKRPCSPAASRGWDDYPCVPEEIGPTMHLHTDAFVAKLIATLEVTIRQHFKDEAGSGHQDRIIPEQLLQAPSTSSCVKVEAKKHAGGRVTTNVKSRQSSAMHPETVFGATTSAVSVRFQENAIEDPERDNAMEAKPRKIPTFNTNMDEEYTETDGEEGKAQRENSGGWDPSDTAKQVWGWGTKQMTKFVSQPHKLHTTLSDQEKMVLERDNAKGMRYAALYLRNLAYGPLVEFLLGVMIILNACVMAFEIHYRSFDTAQQLNTQGAWDHPSRSSEDVWPGAKLAFYSLEMFFGVVFSLEVGVKLVLDVRRFAGTLWNAFDFVLVGTWFASLFGSDSNLMFLRLFRVMRMLRLVRLVKTIQLFDVLHLIVGAVRASLPVFLWSVASLLAIMILGALVLNYALEDFMRDESNLPKARQDVFARFGNFPRALVTMFEVTLGNFFPPIELLREEVSEWYALGFLIYICVVNFAMVQVIRGVFLSETLKSASCDDDVMIMEKERTMRKHAADMHRFFLEADTTGDGFLSFEEFEAMIADPRVRTWLSAMSFDIDDVQLVFQLLDDGDDDKLTGDEVVHGVAKLKGNARSIDLMTLHRRCDRLDGACDHILTEFESLGFAMGMAPVNRSSAMRKSITRRSRAARTTNASRATERRMQYSTQGSAMSSGCASMNWAAT